ncbi:cyclic nucleotide-binding domain-containing protein [Synechococcus sp. HK05]|uniref:cyclic nucleotide-binding domain-containing protein n=1 Tax=Synechococcus sp. HK05 TaxID=2725975 RepID=UPI001C38FC94|nr:cyclic nucleotide-binding domain-containing protein [Synechococcus sp. HK05]MBV2352406.1 cyclic nucleotide-binding domain-containing protein [Synechococcus sp. HK05]
MKTGPPLLDQLLQLQAPLFAGIDPTLLQAWLAAAELRCHARGTTVLRADQLNSQTFLVLSGELVVSLQQGGTAALARIGPGDCVGEGQRSPRATPPLGCAASSRANSG